MARLGFPIMPMRVGPPIGLGVGAIDRCGDGLGFPMSPGDGCHTIMVDGIMQALAGAGYPDLHSVSTSGHLRL